MARRGKRPTMSRFYSGKYQAKIMRQIANRVVSRNIETKQSVFSSADGTEIAHNNFITLDSTVLQTTQGTTDPRTVNTANRIGDTIDLRGVSMKMMFELNERYSDVTLRILVVKAARGDVPTRATLFNGLSGNKMIDTLNTEKYTILASKTLKLQAGNRGSQLTLPVDGGGYITGGDTMSRATKIVKMWIPGKKFAKSGFIKYEDGSSQVKFFDYYVLAYAYSNYSTLQDVWNVARLNDYVKVMYFKDA